MCIRDSLKAALQYLAELRAELAAEEWRLADRDRDLVEGLLPPRVVREHSPAVHPYADQFWALLGWKEMKAAAARLGHTEDATWAESHYRTLRAAVRRSLRERMDRMEGFWLPGAAEDEFLGGIEIACGQLAPDQTEHGKPARDTLKGAHRIGAPGKSPGRFGA